MSNEDSKWDATNLRFRVETSGLKKGHIQERAGVSQSTFTRWLQGRAAPDVPQLATLATLLRCRVRDLLVKDGKR